MKRLNIDTGGVCFTLSNGNSVIQNLARLGLVILHH